MATAQEIAEMGLTPEQYNNLVMRLANRQEMASVSGPGFGVIPGETGYGFADFENPYEYVSAPLSNKGNPTTQQGLQSNQIRVLPDQPVRLYDNKTGQVVFEGIGGAGAQQAAAIAQEISNDLGNKASWKIETATPGTSDWSAVATEKENKSVVGKIADVALPVLASALIPGGGLLGTILPAAAGSAASSVAQGRSLGDTLLRAAIAGGGAGLGEGVFGAGVPTGGEGATVGANLPSFGALAAPYAAEAAGSVAGSAAGSAAGNLIDEIIVTAAKSAAPSGLFPAVTGGIANTLLDRAISQPAQAAQTQQPAQPEYTPPPEEIVLTAPQNILPPAFTAPEALAASAAANALGSTVAQSPEVTQGMTQQEIEDVTMTGAGGGGLLAKLTANMGLTDYLTAASLLGSGVSSLFGGGGGGAATAGPYVSPFGAGVGFGTGQDMRVNPNIADYERYAFGPEASFFAPGYSQLVSGAAGAPMQTAMGPQGAMLNPNTPTYTPLI